MYQPGYMGPPRPEDDPYAPALAPQPMMGPPAMPSGGLYPRAAPPALSVQPKYGWKQALGDVLAPTAAGSLTGPAGTLAGLLYGLDTAAGKYRMARDPVAQMQYAASYEAARYARDNPGIQYETARANALQLPSAVQEWQYFQSLPPDQQKRYIEMKRQAPTAYGAPVQDAQGNWVLPPKLEGGNAAVLGPGPTSPEGFANRAKGEAQVAGATSGASTSAEIAARTSPAAIDAQAALEAAKTGATETTKNNESLYAALTSTTQSMEDARAKLRRIRDKVAAGPETGPLSEWQAIIDPDLQALNAAIEGNVMASMTSAKAAGATFGSFSEGEWNLLRNLGGRLTNQKAANLEILDDALAGMQSQIGENYGRLRRIPKTGRVPVAPKPAAPRKSAGDYLKDAGGQ